MEKYIIPLRSEEGTYKLKDIVLKTTEQDNDHLTIEYDKEPDIINLAEKFHRTYTLDVDPLENVMVEYRSPYSFFQKGEGNNLEKVYVKTVPADRREVVFHAILMGVYNRLTYEIPAKYELADDFRLFMPERYD